VGRRRERTIRKSEDLLSLIPTWDQVSEQKGSSVRLNPLSCIWPPPVTLANPSHKMAICLLSLLLHSQSPALAADPVAVVTTVIPGAVVDSHPYSVIIDDDHQFGYVAVCGDVAPFGESVDAFSARQVVEFDARTLEVSRTFEVGYFPTDLLLLDGDLWVSCSTVSALFRVDLASGLVDSIPITDSNGADIGYPSGLAPGFNGEILVASNGGSFDGSDENVLAIDPVTEQVVQRYQIAGGISVLAALDDGSLLVPIGFPGDDFTAAPLLRWIDPLDGSTISELELDVDTSDFPAPSDLEILDDGTALLTIFGGSSSVYRIDLATRSLYATYPLESGETVQTSVCQGSGGTFLVAEYFANTVSRYDLASGAWIESLEGCLLPNRIARSGGRIFTAQQGLELVTVHAGIDSFIRCDINRDQQVDVADPILLLGYLFLGASISCLDAADFSDDGELDLSDAIGLLSFLFSQGTSPAYPYPVAGDDLYEDSLDCVG